MRETPVKLFSLILLLTVMPLICPGNAGAQKENNATYWLERSIEEKNPERKIEYFRNALAINPNDPETHNNLGILYKNKGLYTEAIAEYHAALEIKSYRTPEYAHHNLGTVYKELEQYKNALKHFKTAIALNPKFAKAYNGLGLTYKAMGEFEKAADSFRQATKLDPDYIQAEYNLKDVWKLPTKDESLDKKVNKLYDQGIVLTKQGKYIKALAVLKKASKLYPENTRIKQKIAEIQRHQEFNRWYKAALTQKGQHNWSSAHNFLEKAVKAATSPGEINKATLLQTEIKTALSKEKKRLKAAILFGRGQIKRENKEWLEAISLFTKLMMLDPDHEGAKEETRLAQIGYYYEQALRNINQSKWEEAEEHLKNLLDIDPTHVEGLAQLKKVTQKLRARKTEYMLEKAEQAFNLGEWKQARRFYLEVLRLSPDNQIAQNTLKKIQETTEGTHKTARAKQSAWEDWAKPIVLIALLLASLTVYYLLSRFLQTTSFLNYYHQAKDHEETKMLYERMLSEDPGRRAVYPLLAETYYELKQDEKTEELLLRCKEYSQQVPSNQAADWIQCIGEIYQRVNKLEESAKYMERALSMQPNNNKIKEKLVMVYKKILKEYDNPQMSARVSQLQPQPSYSPFKDSSEDKLAAEKEKLALLKECFGHNKS